MFPNSLRLTAACVAALSTLGSVYFASILYSSRKQRKSRTKLPNDIYTWRRPDILNIAEEELWQNLNGVLHQAGLTQWVHSHFSCLKSPSRYILANGFAYVTATRGVEDSEFPGPGTAQELSAFDYINPLTRAVETSEGHAVTLRVIAVQNQGHVHLRILRKVAAGPLSLLSNNHCLPMVKELNFDDIHFGAFPRAGGCLDIAFGFWAQNSVGDVLDMMLQTLEGVAFLHEHNIAHRDLFRPNFLVQWHPESLRTMALPVSRPRVYIIDLESAVDFPPEVPEEERTSSGYPFPAWYPVQTYCRPMPPEVEGDKPYCPFKLDIWQLGETFTEQDFKTTIPDIDALLHQFKADDPLLRPSANEALKTLSELVNSRSPASLLIAPQFIDF